MAKYLTVLDSNARTGLTTSPKFYNYEPNNAAHVAVNITDGTNLAVSIKGWDEVSDVGYTILAYTCLNGMTVLRVGPELTAAGPTAKDYLPYLWYVEATTSGSTTFSIGASMI